MTERRQAIIILVYQTNNENTKASLISFNFLSVRMGDIVFERLQITTIHARFSTDRARSLIKESLVSFVKHYSFFINKKKNRKFPNIKSTKNEKETRKLTSKRVEERQGWVKCNKRERLWWKKNYRRLREKVSS